ncbi:Predicted dehydrogenase [Palleronia marisminoris]|uniref:Putative oxidoreductase YteT n=1 Tax=Palleronia marisminoris TaxID=315423 RepID=A0A1Y5SB24_9RHOB|nr:Gfo/Idh/MocA family oxidoreductase [Palleronia marisminoris]SFG65334.1 Predicted dehydrogenase [Palleronia marisminoris]SLN33664.1 Putative oxidoreductase YteT precursor [Palleronia marisminoris]
MSGNTAKRVTYGVIGCGMMGREHLRNIALLDGAEVGVIFEPDAEMRARARDLAPHAVFVEDLDALLAHEPLDCLLIASPNFRHVEQLHTIAARRPLPVLVEKPLFTGMDQASAIDDLMRDYPAAIWVAMEYRYMPPVAAFLAEAQDVTGGITMLSIREHRFPFLNKVGDWNRFNRFTGGTFVEKCCHFFDLMRLVLGADPVRVMAMGGQAANHLFETYANGSPDVFDHGYVLVEFANGARAMLELCMFAEGSQWQEELMAVGPRGKIEAFVPGPGRFWPDSLGAPPVPELVVSPREPMGPRTRQVPVDPTLLAAGDHNGSTYFQHRGFIEMVRGVRAVPEVGLSDGKWAVLIGLAAQASMVEGRAVSMDEMLG